MPKVQPSIHDLIDFLAKPSSYSHRPAFVKIIQTHASVVALAGDLVFKLKKDLNLGFLDFSTLEKRKFYSQEEIRLNQRLSKGLYLSLDPIYYHQGQLSFTDQQGEIVNYVIQMRRLSQENFLINLMEEPGFDWKQLDRLAGKLIDFYRHPGTSPEVIAWGHPQKVQISIDENFAQTEAYINDTLPVLAFNTIRTYQLNFLKNHNELMERRMEEGKIIEGHGDLRSEHIHITEDQINIYDCVEFNERLRYLDQLSDLAFLAMDMEHRHHWDLSTYLMHQVLDALHDEEAHHLFNFYKSYRAYVRGKVDSFKATEPEIEPEIQEESRQKAQRYFKLALRYAVLGSTPMVIVVLGGVATGKSTMAELLAQTLNLERFNSDIYRKHMAGVDIREPLKEEYYSTEITQKVYQELIDHALDSVRTNGAAIIDATYRQSLELERLRQACEQKNICVVVVQTIASEEMVLERLKKRENKATISDVRLSNYKPQQFKLQYDPRSLCNAYLVCDTTCSAQEALVQLITDLKSFRDSLANLHLQTR